MAQVEPKATTGPKDREPVDHPVGRLSHQDPARIAAERLRDISGDVADATPEVLVPGRRP